MSEAASEAENLRTATRLAAAEARYEIEREIVEKTIECHESVRPFIEAEINAAKAALARGDTDSLLIAFLRTYRAIDHSKPHYTMPS